MVKVVYVDWRDRQFPPEILGVCTKDTMAEKLRDDKVKELVSEGYEMEEEVNVIIDEFELNDDEPVDQPVWGESPRPGLGACHPGVRDPGHGGMRRAGHHHRGPGL